MRRSFFTAIALCSFFVASRGGAQGAISLQGLGYPAGGISARAEGAGSGVADFDALSAVTPASLAGVGSPALYLQYSPEFRRVTTSSGTANTTTARFPVIMGVIPMGQSWTLGLSASTFLDRSSETTLERLQVVGGPTDTVTLTEQNKILGAIDDYRLALAWSTSPGFRIGVGGHVFAGSNRITFSQLFPDSAEFISSAQAGRISFAGFAASAGLEYHPVRAIGFAISGRKGGDLRAQSGDTAIGKAKLPDHYSGSVTFEGIPGVTLSARAAHDNWSSLNSLSSTGTQAFDGWDFGGGAEATGPRILSRIVTVRVGARSRTLPFGLNGEKVTERIFAAGFGAPLTRERASLDVAIQRAARSTASSDVKERGYILSIGLRVSP
jgi:hypothetical protein